MKHTRKVIAGLTGIACSLALNACQDKTSHVPHDHDGDGLADHGPGEHQAPAPRDHDEHGHDEEDHPKKLAGPNGGRIITSVEPHAEFSVSSENKVRITFLDEQNTAIPVAGQTVDVVCGDRSNPTILTFAKIADGAFLMSNEKLPEGNKYPVILTIKTDQNASPVREKFILDLSACSTCDYLEYACICDHHHGHDHGDHGDHGHDHGHDH